MPKALIQNEIYAQCVAYEGIFKLCKKYKDIAICWHAYEDSPQTLILKYISNKTYIELKTLKGKTKNTINDRMKAHISTLQNEINNYDIEFEYKSKKVSEINKHFSTFCADRPGKFCILVIDNIMKLNDQKQSKAQTQIDDDIARDIGDIFNDTKDYKRSIFLLHHVTKDSINKENLKYGYRLGKGSTKGSSRYEDIATQLLLISFPKLHPDLVSCYKDYEELLNNLWILDVPKNRDGNLGHIRYFADLNYNIFLECNSLSI